MDAALPEVARACQELLKCGNASAEMLGFHAQVFATVVEHVTVNVSTLIYCFLVG